MKLRKFKFGILVILFFLCSISVEAASCRLQVSLGKEGSQVELSIYKIANVKEAAYEWLPEYNGMDIELSQLEKAKDIKEASEKIRDWIEEKKLPPDKTGQSNESGELVFSVDSGAYLIVKESAEGEMAPVLVMIPEGYDSQTFQVSPKYSKSEEAVNNVQNTVATEQKVEGVATGDQAVPMLWVGVMAIISNLIIFLVKSRQKKYD